MFELTINEQVYQFNFGIGFVKEINKMVSVPIEGMQGVKRDTGLRYKVACFIDGDVEALIDILDIANKGRDLRITHAALEGYIEDESTDIDQLFDKVMDFLRKANCTKKVVESILKAVPSAAQDAEKVNNQS